MENINLKVSANTSKSISKLVENINSTCDALLDSLVASPSSVSNYGISVAQTIDSEFVDRVIRNIGKLKAHLKDITTHLDFAEMDNKRVREINNSLKEVSDELNETAASNNYFYNTYGWVIQEVNTMINKVINKLPVGKLIMEEVQHKMTA